MSSQIQVNRISKDDQRYVLLSKINFNEREYNYDERSITVRLKIRKYKDYVLTFYDSPTHPVFIIEVFVIDDFERWYDDDNDEYGSHIEQHYMNTFGIYRIATDDPRYVSLSKINFNNKEYNYDERSITIRLKIKKYKDYVLTFYDSPSHPVFTIEVFVIDDFDSWYLTGGDINEYGCHIEQDYMYTFGIDRIPLYDERYDILNKLFSKQLNDEIYSLNYLRQ
jgi:hypothetical protein